MSSYRQNPCTRQFVRIARNCEKEKGIGLKVTGITKRRFQPNLKKKRLWFAPENRFITLRLSTNALRTIDKIGLPAVVRDLRSRGEHV